jgi:two-component system KDP operon response regulator KdpE
VATHDYLMREARGAAHLRATHYLHILVRKIRHKIESDPTQPKLLINELGVGSGLA